jgi:glycoside/pentoside/hexuronide:cation symporter, GPH family
MAHLIEKESTEEVKHPHVDVPRKKRFLWGMGGFADSTIVNGSAANISFIFVSSMGFRADLVMWACALPRLFDAFTDPIVGHLSDNTRSRWGRRRPWMLAGLIASAILGVMIWYPPQAAKTGWDWGLFTFLFAMMSLLFGVGYTMFNVPHIAMGYEMSTDYNERTHLFKWRQFTFAAAGFVTPWIMTACMWLEGDQAKVLKGAEGIRTVSIVLGGIVLLTGLPSVFFCKEKVHIHREEDKVRFLDAIKMTLHNRPFWLLVVSNFVAKFCMAITGIFFVYIFWHHLGRGNQTDGSVYLAVFFNAINVFTISAIAPVAWLTERIGKKPALLLTLAMSTVAYLSLWFTFSTADGAYVNFATPAVEFALKWPSLIVMGAFLLLAMLPRAWFPRGLGKPRSLAYLMGLGAVAYLALWFASPEVLNFTLPGKIFSMQWPCLITALLIGVFTNTMPMINNSMLADVCDLDELRSGHRREAFYGAVFTTIDKAAIFLALVLQGYLVIFSGFNADLEQQAMSTINFWLLGLIITQPVGFLIGMIAVAMYPLTRARCWWAR